MRREYVKLALFVAALIVVLIIHFCASGCAASQIPVTTDVSISMRSDCTEVELVEVEEDPVEVARGGEVPLNPYPETSAPDTWLGLQLPPGWTLGFLAGEDEFRVFSPGGEANVWVRVNPSRDRIIWSVAYDIFTESGYRHGRPFGTMPMDGPMPASLRLSAVENHRCEECPMEVTVSINWPMAVSDLSSLELLLQRLDDIIPPPFEPDEEEGEEVDGEAESE
ncbi:MAG: hypothetical protein U9Q03_00910 [Patescibacteria group bacterium]|nr:hypothetical protein [Patescibacteria group bacterium]